MHDKEILELVDKIKNKIENVTFSTDIIVGFPGESEEDFEDTLDVINKVGYDQVFMFIYSIRRGTPAEKMKDQILAGQVKKAFSDKVLMNQPYILDDTKTVEQFIKEAIAKTGENITVRQLKRIELGVTE